jgi:hypothetical protein
MNLIILYLKCWNATEQCFESMFLLDLVEVKPWNQDFNFTQTKVECFHALPSKGHIAEAEEKDKGDRYTILEAERSNGAIELTKFVSPLEEMEQCTRVQC